MKKYCFGIDVGGTTVKCGLFDVDGNLLDKWEIPTRTEEDGKNILPDVAYSVAVKIQEKGLDKEEIAGVGIGIPGPVDENGNISMAVNLHWGQKAISKELGELTGLPVKAGNDANVAALGEMWMGGGAGYKDLIVVTLGTGVGGGIIVNGKVVTGAHGAGGEIGHGHVADDISDPCNCGNVGCLEQVTSATGIARLGREKLASSDRPSIMRSAKEISAKTVFDAVKEEDTLAMEVAEQFGEYMGRGLAIFACVTDPEIFVIGGGVSKAGPVVLDYIRKYYRKYAFPGCRDAKFALAKLGNDAGIYGAAKLVLGD